MEKSAFDEITSALTVQSLCSRLGPDVPSGSRISDLEAILIDAEVDPMNCPSRIIDADGNVKGVLWYENWSSVDEMGEGPGIVDEVAEKLEPNEFLSTDTNVLDAVNKRRGAPAEVRAQLSLAAFFPWRIAESDFGSRYSAQSKQEHVMRKVIRGYAKDKNLKTRVELRCTLVGMCLRSLARPAAKKDS